MIGQPWITLLDSGRYKDMSLLLLWPAIDRGARPLGTGTKGADEDAQEEIVYVIDDNPAVRETIAEFVKACGFKPVAVEASNMRVTLVSRRPAAIISDVMMPDRDGIEVVSDIAEVAADVPVLLVSGYGPRYLQMAQRLAHTAGVRACQTRPKPLRLADVRSFLSAAVGLQRPLQGNGD